jgi:hypothetical protein
VSNDTGKQFIGGVVDTSEQFFGSVVDTVNNFMLSGYF